VTVLRYRLKIIATFLFLLFSSMVLNQQADCTLSVNGRLMTQEENDASVEKAGSWILSLCNGDAGCKIESIADAGRDVEKNELQIVQLDRQGGDEFPRNGEVWLVRKSSDTVLGKRLLVKFEDLDYDDESTVATNRLDFQIWTAAMHTNFWHAFTIQLSPLLILAEDAGGSSHEGDIQIDGSEQKYSWDNLSGFIKHVNNSNVSEYYPIPKVNSPGNWLNEWAHSQLGSCALSLGSMESPGFILARKENIAIPTIKIVMPSDNDLLVQVPDGSFVTGSPDSDNDDHLELWVAQGSKAKQWEIRIADGAVYPAYGQPESSSLVVESAKFASRKNETYRLFKIHLLSVPKSLAVSYSKGNGKHVQVLDSTSHLVFGHAETLGDIRVIPAAVGGCIFKDQTMEFQLVHQPKGNEPLVECANNKCHSPLLDEGE
jgi:hypothetical protein